MREQRRVERRKEVKKSRKEFLEDPYKFAKGLFLESKAGKIKCTKGELEEGHLANTYSDPRRDEELSPFTGRKRPTQPRVQFDLGDLNKKEAYDFVKKARAKGSSGNNSISYKMYKRCNKLRKQLFIVLKQM